MKKFNTLLSNIRKGKKLLLATAMLLTASGFVQAQTNIANYQLTKSTGTYTPITGGTAFITANTPFDNEISAAITMPAFTFGGTNITTVYISANGYITFGAAPAGGNYTPLSTTAATITGVVAAMACDLGYTSTTTTTGATPEIRYQQVGTEFVVQWQDIKRWVSPNERMSFQIRLNAATGEIKIVYGGPIVLGTDTRSPQVGLRGNSTTWASNVNNLYLLNAPIGTTCNWNDAITGNANDASFTMSSGNTAMAPTDGLTYTWTPAASPAPVRTFSAVSAISGSGATIGWTAATGATQYNVQYRIPGTCSWTNFSGNPVTGTSAVLNGLASSTVYQVRVQSINGASTSIWSHIPNTAGTGNGYSATGTFMTLCGTPTPGATIASVNNICMGTLVTFSMANPGAGVTYQWQSSSDNVTYTNISGATAATLSTPAITNYYRCAVTCATGPNTVNSTPVQINYTNSITATTPGTRCGIGTVNLAASGSAGTTLKWYNAASGGAALGTGSPFTTPSISTTTNFYVGAEVITPGLIPVGLGALTGNSVAYNPLQGGYGGMKTQFLYTASELQAAGLTAGNITSLALDITTAGAALSGFNIQIGTTTLTDFVSPVNIQGALSNAYSVATFTPVLGVNTFTLGTPFNWNGTSNIIVSISWSNNNTSNTSSSLKYDNTTNYSSQSYRKDSETSANMLAFTGATGSGTNTFDRSQARAKVIFGGQAVCSSPRSIVTATVNTPPAFTVTDSQTVCNNAVTALTVTSPTANFNSYTWSPAANLYTDATGTTPYVSGASASTVYLKSATAGQVLYIATANNTTTLCAASDTSVMTVLPAAVTAIATPASICASGTTTLALIPATGYAAGKFQWQSSANNTTFTDIAGAIAATYTTPVITATAYYRAQIKNSAGTTCIASSSDTAKVYAPAITGTTPASRCGPGTVTLGANGTDGTLKWYAAATGGAALGTGNTFTTPSIAATTTYYVGSEALPSGNFTVGTGTTLTSATGYPTAFMNRHSQYWNQMVFTAAELNAAGLSAGSINSLTFKIAALGDAANVTNFTIMMGPTGSSTLSGFTTTGLNTVYGPSTYTSAVGNNTVTFTNPYIWDGTSNILVDIRQNGIDNINNATTYYTATTGNTVVYAFTSNTTPILYTSSPTATTSTSRLNVTFNQTGCQSPRTPVTATVNAIPAAGVSPAAVPVQICQGNTTTLTGSGGGSYQWINANGPLPGAQSATFTTGTTGLYSVIVTTPATGCSDTSDAVTVNVNPLPVVALGNDTAICADYTLTLNAGNPGATYLWNNGTANQSLAVNTTGIYSVKVTDTNTCSKSDTINILVNPLPVVNLGNDTAFCNGNSLILNAGNPGAQYLWNNGTINQALAVNTTGNYSVVVTDNNSCKGSDNINILVKTAPTGTINAVYGDTATYTFNVLNAQFVQQYTWNFGDGSPAVNGAVVHHRYANNGIYLVTVNLGGECSDSLGQSVTVDVFDANGGTGIVKIDNPEDLLLYPNPARDQITIENKQGLKLLNITAYNLLGQVVYNKKADSNDKHRLVTTGIAAGVYTLKIETDKGFAVRKFEVLK